MAPAWKYVKEDLMRRGLDLLSHPKVADIVASPRVMETVAKGTVLKSQISEGIGECLDSGRRALADTLKLATRADLALVEEILKRELAMKQGASSSALHADPQPEGRRVQHLQHPSE